MHRAFRKIKFAAVKIVFCTICFCALLFSISINAQNGNPKNETAISDGFLMRKIELSASNKQFKFDSNEINEIKTHFDQLKRIYKNPTALSEEQKMLLAFYIGAFYYYIDEDYKNCVAYLSEVFLHRNQLTTDQQFSLYFLLADSENALGNHLKSIFYYDHYLKLAKKSKSHLEEYRANIEIGVRYRDLKEYDLAKKYLSLALDLQKKNKFRGEEEIWLYIHYGRFYREIKNYDFALYSFNKAINHKEIKEYSKWQPYIYSEFAFLWRELNKTDSVKKYAQKIIDETNDNIADRSNKKLAQKYDRLVLPQAYLFLGEIALKNNDAENANTYYSNAFFLGRDIGVKNETRNAAKVLFRLKTTNSKLKQQAIDFLQKSYSEENMLEDQNKLFASYLASISSKSKIVDSKLEILQSQTLFFTVITPFLLLLTFFILVIRRKVRISNTKKTELFYLNNKMKAANSKLSETNKELDQFASIVSKDLKFSINKIKKRINSLLHSNTEKTTAIENSVVNKLCIDADKLSDLTDNLLQTAINSRDNNIFAQKIDFTELIDQVKDSLKNSILLMEPRFVVSNDFPTFYGYKIQLFQLFKNIIENALKYSHPSVRPEITIDITKKSRVLTIIIADNGIGIPKAKQAEIFELFSQSRDFDMSKGMGIGLNICKKIVSNYNGKIQVTSAEGEGCQFIIELNEIKRKNNK